MIILDFGSGNTCRNKEKEAKRMIDDLSKVDSKKNKVIIKWQLWDQTNPQGDNIRLEWLLFHAMSNYAFEKHGYETTASVFDRESLNFLINLNLPYKLPFIKIANRKDLYYLIGEVPRKHRIICSYDPDTYDVVRYFYRDKFLPMYCVSKYPANINDYITKFKLDAVSDHTKDLTIYQEQRPKTIEMHYALSNQKGLDADSGVCKTPEMLMEIL